MLWLQLLLTHDPVTRMPVEPRHLGLVCVYSALAFVSAALCFHFVGGVGHTWRQGARVGALGGAIPTVLWLVVRATRAGALEVPEIGALLPLVVGASAGALGSWLRGWVLRAPSRG